MNKAMIKRSLTGLLLFVMVFTGFTGSVFAAADPSIEVIRHVAKDAGTTRVEIYVNDLPSETKGVQFDLLTNSSLELLPIVWNSKVEGEYAYMQDQVQVDGKVKLTFYLTGKNMIPSTNRLHVGDITIKNLDVPLETTGQMKWLDDRLKENYLEHVELLVQTKETVTDSGSDNESSNNDSDDNNMNTDQGDEDDNTDNGAQESNPDQDGTSNDTDKPVSFSDIAGHWAEDAIRYVSAEGIMNGAGNGKFEPNTTMTRAMFVQTIYNAESRLTNEEPKSSSSTFEDVPTNAWYAEAVNWAVEQGIVKGIGNNSFAPLQEVNREQLAVMLANYCKLKGFELPESGDVKKFVDEDAISPWALDAVLLMQKAGIINGKSNQSFDPKGKATRAEVAVVFEKIMSKQLASN